MISKKLHSIIIGILFLSAFPLYGIGSSLLVGSSSATLGLVLVLTNSVAVLTIGWILKLILTPYDKNVAIIYFMARLNEASLLAIYAIVVYNGADAQSAIYILYRISMIGLALGSLPLLRMLKNHQLISALLGWFGIIGYSCVFGGIVVDSLGYVDLGLLMMIPGALFEITFGVWFIVQGLPLEPNYESIV
mmetsp:Transcript_17917/g.26830  ORF Transcript_17917/g.26830 Transcript_17917/m.26830 type:complete len:191 (+) Transcript_17917:51-623(+)